MRVHVIVMLKAGNRTAEYVLLCTVPRPPMYRQSPRPYYLLPRFRHYRSNLFDILEIGHDSPGAVHLAHDPRMIDEAIIRKSSKGLITGIPVDWWTIPARVYP